MRLIRLKKLTKHINESSPSSDSDYITLLQSVIESNDNVVSFLHNTHTKEDAESILKGGFEFQNHLDYTTDIISAKDIVAIRYFSNVRSTYGKFTIVIQISKQIIDEYCRVLNCKSHHYSEVLTVKTPYVGSDGDLIYCLAPHFVKGYINSNTAKFYPNNSFDAVLKLAVFDDNLKKII